MPQEMTWRKAIEKVLSEAQGAMHYKDITEKIIQNGFRSNLGATPSATVSSELTKPINNEGANCPFQKVGSGLYIWKGKVGGKQFSQPLKEESEVEEKEPQYDIITSFGMFWRRDAIDWVSTPKILGMQQIGADAVDFYRQIGIYLLYDGREAIYVGRATERPLGKRLYEHTFDRFTSRWDRFSWFGFLPVSEKGILGNLPQSYEAIKVIPAMEAIIIEALEPRQNRKRGDDLSAVEYIQKEDPEIQKKKAKQTVDSLLEKL